MSDKSGDEDWISPPDDEEEAVERLALHAAMSELRGHVLYGDHESTDVVRRILRATNVVTQVVRKANADFKARNPGKNYIGFCVSSQLWIIASAYWACCNDIDESEVSPMCAGGQATLDFAAAIALLNAADSAKWILSEGSSALFGVEDGALLLGSASTVNDQVINRTNKQ